MVRYPPLSFNAEPYSILICFRHPAGNGNVEGKDDLHTLGMPIGTFHFAGTELGGLSSTTGLPLFSAEGQEWVQIKSGESVSMDKLCRELSEKSRSSLSSPRTSEPPRIDSIVLPDRIIVERSARFYRTSIFQVIFPVLDLELFHDTIKRAYESTDNSPETTSAKCCILAFIALAAFFELETGCPPYHISNHLTMIELEIPNIIEGMTIDSFQTCVMLVRTRFILAPSFSTTSLQHKELTHTI